MRWSMWPACSDEGGLEGLVEEEALMGGALPSAAAEVVGGVGDGEEGVEPLASCRRADAAERREDDSEEGAVELGAQPGGRCFFSFSDARALKREAAEEAAAAPQNKITRRTAYNEAKCAMIIHSAMDREVRFIRPCLRRRHFGRLSIATRFEFCDAVFNSQCAVMCHLAAQMRRRA